MRRRIGALLAATVIAAAASAHADESGRYDFTGTIGAYPAGLTLRVAPDGHVLDGHCFYIRHLTDIPLAIHRAAQAGGEIDLSEPGGASLALHPVTKTGPVAFLADATSLGGTWTGTGHTLPVSLQLRDIVSATGRRYADVTTESDSAFEARVRGFRTAVLDDRPDAATRFTSFPLRINGSVPRVIRSAAELRAQWSAVFTPALLTRLRTTVPHDLFVHDGEAALGNGLVWFDATGAQQINVAA